MAKRTAWANAPETKALRRWLQQQRRHWIAFAPRALNTHRCLGMAAFAERALERLNSTSKQDSR